MTFELPELLDGKSGVACGVAAAAVAVVVVARLSSRRGPNLDAFPIAGSTSLLTSWWGLRFISNMTNAIQEGYDKYKGAPFKIATGYKWSVILSSREHLEEIAKAPESAISFFKAVDNLTNLHLVLSPDINGTPYHNPVIRFRLTRNLEAIFPEVREELVTSFDDMLGLKGDHHGWKSIPAYHAVEKVICRTSTRLLVGPSLSNDPEWIDLSVESNLEIAKAGGVIGLFPAFLRPLAARFCTKAASCIKRSTQYLAPIIEERLRYINEYGDKWIEKPNDLLSWLIDEAKGPQLTVKSLVARLLFINGGALHTTAMSFTHVLFYLAAHPQYIKPLREEVESIVEQDGWSAAALSKMLKIDSFLRECQRLEGVSSVGLIRMAAQDFTFSDGTCIPKGTIIFAASQPIHYDGQNYAQAHAFEPFRFVDMQEEDGKDSKHHFVATSAEYLAFGHGRHACPGRFFAATEMRTLLAHVVLTYDLKLEHNMKQPSRIYFGAGIAPDFHAKVMFRNRAD